MSPHPLRNKIHLFHDYTGEFLSFQQLFYSPAGYYLPPGNEIANRTMPATNSPQHTERKIAKEEYAAFIWICVEIYVNLRSKS